MRVGLVCIILYILVCFFFKVLFWWILICFFNLLYGFFLGLDIWNDVSGWYFFEEFYGKKFIKEFSFW